MIYRTVPVSTEFDLNAVCGGDGVLFVQSGIGSAGRNEVLRTDSDAMRAVLNEMTLSRHAQPTESTLASPIAFGLVPFLPKNPSVFLLMGVTFTKHSDGSATMTVVSDSEDDLTDESLQTLLESSNDSRPPRPSSNSYRVSPVMPVGRYLDTVTAARDAVRAGLLRKAVIARDIEVHADDPIDTHAVLLRLRALFGSSYRYCINNMIGASPELLVEVTGRTVRSHPLAGTAPRSGDAETDAALAEALIASTKDQLEHRVVIDMVHDTLLPHCSYLDWEAEPSIVTVANVQHLGTAIEGALHDPPAHVFTLVQALCPTPALGGFPSSEAIDFITEHEEMDRNFYGGAVGWMNRDGDGCFAVTIRCAELSNDRRSARLFAGGGIVADSNPYSELAETQAKFQAMLSAIVRP